METLRIRRHKGFIKVITGIRRCGKSFRSDGSEKTGTTILSWETDVFFICTIVFSSSISVIGKGNEIFFFDKIIFEILGHQFDREVFSFGDEFFFQNVLMCDSCEFFFQIDFQMKFFLFFPIPFLLFFEQWIEINRVFGMLIGKID